MNTNRQKNLAHEQRQQSKQRPSNINYNFAPLEQAMKQWIQRSAEENYSP